MKKTIGFMIILVIALIAMSTISNAAEVATWDDLKTALEGTDETVTLTENVEGMAEDITVSGIKILDLNGKTLTLKQNIIINGGNLTVTGNGKIESTTAARIFDVKAGSALVLKNGSFTITKAGAQVIRVIGSLTDDGSKTKVTIEKDAKISANYCILVSHNGQSSSWGVEVNVYGTLTGIVGNPGWENYGATNLYVNGKVKATTGNVPVINVYEGASLTVPDGQAVYAAGYAIWNISGGYFEGAEALGIKSGKFNITGGTFKATGEYAEPEANSNGTEASGSAISITNTKTYSGNVEISIANANVSSKEGYAILETTTNGDATVVNAMNIKSGNFEGEKGAVLIVNEEEVGKFIEGGTFNDDVSEYVTDELESVEENGVHYVGKSNAIKVENTVNGKITISVNNAIKGQTVKLGTTAEEGYILDSIKVYDAENREVAVNGTEFIMPDSEVTIKVAFKELPKEDEEPEKPAPVEKPEEKPTEKPAEKPVEEPVKEEKDETPKTGSLDIVLYISAIVAVISLAGIEVLKRNNK